MDAHTWAVDQRNIKLPAASLERSWTGFDVQVYDTLGGFAEMPPRTHHRVRMHLGAPIFSTY